MKLLLRRDQRSGVLGVGKVTFVLEVRAELSKEELDTIRKYKMGDTVLYEKDTIVDKGSGLLGLASRLAHKMLNVSVSVNDLTNGKRVECKDILEMIAVEDQVKEAAQTFMRVLAAAKHFGGEEIVQIA